MKELFAAFGNEVFRPLVTLVIPGGTAIAPYLTYFYLEYPSLRLTISNHGAEAVALAALASIFFGLVIDDLGTHIEGGWDRSLSPEDESNWFRYLRFAFRYEPIGHRYLRNLVLRLKFELASYIALLVSLPGLFWFLLTRLDAPEVLATTCGGSLRPCGLPRPRHAVWKRRIPRISGRSRAMRRSDDAFTPAATPPLLECRPRGISP